MDRVDMMRESVKMNSGTLTEKGHRLNEKGTSRRRGREDTNSHWRLLTVEIHFKVGGREDGGEGRDRTLKIR